MQGAASVVLFLGRSGQGLQQQDDDKSTRPFSLCLRVSLTISFSKATVKAGRARDFPLNMVEEEV